MKSAVYIVHGWQGSSTSGWKPWLKKELESKGYQVLSLDMPNTNSPICSEWVDHLSKSIVHLPEQTILVGHSLGCITILRYLEQTQKQNLNAAILLAGFNSNLGYSELNSFVQNPNFDWDKIKQACKKFTAIHSDNDPFVSTHYGSDIFKNNLDAEYILDPGMGHFSHENGIFEVKSLLQAIIAV